METPAIVINNKLVLLKKDVIIGKRGATRDLQMKIKKFAKQKNTESKIKNAEVQIEIIKGLDPMDIAKNAVLCERDPTEIINDYNVLPKDRALARIFNNVKVKNHVKEFKQNVAIEGWRAILKGDNKLGKVKSLKLAYKQKNTEKKQAKALKRNRLKWLTENPIEENDDDVAKVEETEQNIVEVKHKSCKRKIKVIENETKEEQIDKEIKPIEDLAFKVDSFFVTKTGKNFISNTKELPKEEINENNNSNDDWNGGSYSKKFRDSDHSIKNLNKFQNTNYANKHNNFNNGTDEKWNNQNMRPGVITNNANIDTKYRIQTNTPVIDPTLHPSWIAKINQKPKMVEFQGTKTVFDDNADHPPIQPFTNKKPKIIEDVSKKWNKQNTRYGIINADIHTKNKSQTNNNVVDQTLHPSWIAKKSQNAMVEFQGTKTVFDDNNDDHPHIHSFSNKKPKIIEDVSQKWNKQNTRYGIKNADIHTKNKSQTNNNNVDQTLHPSWIAKKSQKAMVEFQGTKTVFD